MISTVRDVVYRLKYLQHFIYCGILLYLKAVLQSIVLEKVKIL